jgi:hypothetical protein
MHVSLITSTALYTPPIRSQTSVPPLLASANPHTLYNSGYFYSTIHHRGAIHMAINSDPDRSLCHRCQSLPLSTLFYGPHNSKLNETFFHPLHVVWAATTCKFCLLIQSLLKSHYGKDYIAAKLEGGFDQELRLYRNPLDLSFDEYHMQGREGQEMPFFLQIGCLGPRAHAGNPAAHFRREDRARSDEGSREWVMPSIFAVKHEIDYADRSVGSVSLEQPGRLVDYREVNWALLALWDASCPHHVMDATSQQSGNSEDSYRSRLRVIDVENACVTRCPPTTPYVALSYQWGSDQKLKLKKENITLLETPGFFDTSEGEPAQTIRDAIVTVKRLGYKYAWVDALCIVVFSLPSNSSCTSLTVHAARRCRKRGSERRPDGSDIPGSAPHHRSCSWGERLLRASRRLDDAKGGSSIKSCRR